MNAGELINSLAERTGYASDTLKDLLANPALSQITIPDDLKTTINTSLLSVKEAKINPEIKKHFAGVHLGSVDAVLNELLDNYELPDDVKQTIKSDGGTHDKIRVFTKALADLKEEAAKSVGGEKAKLVDQISKLNADIVALKDQAKNEVARVTTEYQTKFADHLINGHFNKYEYAMDNIPVDIQASSARMMFEKKLAEKGGKMKFEDGNIRLVLSVDESLPFTIENKEVDFNTFSDSVVGEAKIIKVKGQPNPTPSPTPSPRPAPTPQFAPAAKSAISKALEDLKSGS